MTIIRYGSSCCLESDLCSKEGEQEVDVNGNLNELGVDEGDVHPGKVDQPSVGLGNVREIPVSLSTVSKNYPRPHAVAHIYSLS